MSEQDSDPEERHPIERILASERRGDLEDPAERKRRDAARRDAYRKARAREAGGQDARRWFFILTGVCGFLLGWFGLAMGMNFLRRAHQILRIRVLGATIVAAILMVAVSAGLNLAYAAYRRRRAINRASESSRPARGQP